MITCKHGERDRLAAENASLEAMLADEVAENVRLRSREVGDEVGNLLQEVADLKNQIAELDEAINECIKDRDWFSDRLDAATAELARVKAESLRVVVDECQNMDIASDWYMTLDGLGWLGYDRHDCECVETPHGYHKFDDCRKVKLERWEDEG